MTTGTLPQQEQQVERPVRTGTLYIVNGSASKPVTYDRNDPADVAAIEGMVANHQAQGYALFSSVDGQPGEQVDKFDAEADEVVLVGAYMGG